MKAQTLLGVTGSGKTYTMAKTIEEVGRPALVIAHNKTLAAQLANEFAEFFPNNAVEYFVSYYDYYQPRRTCPVRHVHREGRPDQRGHRPPQALRDERLFTRRDVIVVASVSAIYGLGSPEEYRSKMVLLEKGGFYDLDDVCGPRAYPVRQERLPARPRHLPDAGEVLEVHPPYQTRSTGSPSSETRSRGRRRWTP
jgi:excinuclease ABC subunit B